ncbi:MAG: hypothetical protein IT211_12800 [Armatimonadetes bacterium]|nr:hypothetical protein [Armatimonadota bacterium]
MKYPLQLSFKVVALSQKMRVTDADGTLICFVKQKAFKLKEDVTVFADEAMTEPLYKINADRVFDWSAKYHFRNADGTPIGFIQREGRKSLWKASYKINDGTAEVMNIKEENPWAKFFDAFLGELPIVGMFTGYLFHPSYILCSTNGTELIRIKKQPAFFEGKFNIEQLTEMPPEEELRSLMGLMMMVLVERSRG